MKLADSKLVRSLVELAIAEDLSYGDLSADLLDSETDTVAELISKEDLIVCGVGLTSIIADCAGKKLEIYDLVKDGDSVKAKTSLQKIIGPANSIVSLERIILNFIQRLSGVATFTNNIVKTCPAISILDTRKTMPGFRVLEKYATAVGGARNHRMHLGEMIMIKNNHIDAAPGLSLDQRVDYLMQRVATKNSFYTPVEVEVRNLAELAIVLKYKPVAVLLDNMNDHDLANCLQLVHVQAPETICEVSGGITIDRLKHLAAMGVKVCSMGALTTKATNVDISLRILK